MSKILFQFTLSLLGLLLLASPAASALTVEGPRDCDSNAIIHCGALTTKELKQDVAGSDYAQKVFRSFGISSSQVQAIGESAVGGKVTKEGEVFIDSKISAVAKNAVTAGRQDMPGSTRVVSEGAIFYKRSPSVSFQRESLPAFVVMKDGQFQYAVIASCGNPVVATPISRKKAQTQPEQQPVQPVTPTKPEAEKEEQPPAPAPVQQQSQAQAQSQSVSQSQSQQVIVEQAAAPAPPAPAPSVVAAAPEKPVAKQDTLPNVGIAGGTSLFLLSSLIGTAVFRRWLVNQ